MKSQRGSQGSNFTKATGIRSTLGVFPGGASLSPTMNETGLGANRMRSSPTDRYVLEHCSFCSQPETRFRRQAMVMTYQVAYGPTEIGGFYGATMVPCFMRFEQQGIMSDRYYTQSPSGE